MPGVAIGDSEFTMRVYCDFDGTVTKADTTDEVLSRLAGDDWMRLEDEWVAGRMSAADCMRAQIALVRHDDMALDAVLDTMTIRDGFADLVHWCRDQKVPFTIVSDGVDRFIHRILARHDLGHIPVFSNRLVSAQGAYGLEQPFKRQGCAAGSGVCKCEIVDVAPPAEPMVFIGDGRSDFCVSGRAELLFARDRLAEYAEQRGQAYIPFDNFFDVLLALKAHVAERRTA